jgi:hypothetical protein
MVYYHKALSLNYRVYTWAWLLYSIHYIQITCLYTSSHADIHVGPRRYGAQCIFAQSHALVGFAEPSESYIFVAIMSIIDRVPHIL